jgi:HAD superfamily hydrolase (TIGR01509 family)
MPKPAAVLFDLGGVACHFLPERRLAGLAAASGLAAAEVRARLWQSGFDAACDRGAYSTEEMRAGIADRLAVSFSPERLETIWASAFEPHADVLALAQQLHADGTTVALLTDNGPLLREALPAQLPEVAATFAPLLFSCDLGALKPSPALFQAAADRLAAPCERLLLIDDAPQNVAGARAAGMQALRFTDATALGRALTACGLLR